MEQRNYIIYNTDNADEVIATGKSNFFDDPEWVVPPGFEMDCVNNSPNCVRIYVKKATQ